MTVTAGRAAAPGPHFDPYDPSFIDDPYPTYRRLRDEAPVFRAEMGFWVVTRYDDVMESLRDPRGSREHWRLNQQYLESHAGASDEWNHFVRDQVQFLDPPSHTRQRKLVSKAFTPRAIEDRRPVVQRLVNDIVDRALERGSMEVIAELARPLPYRVICELLGLPVDDPRIQSGWITSIVRGLSTIVTEDDMRAASDALAEITEIVGETIEARRSAPRDDLLSGLIAAEEQGDVLTDHEVLSLVINLFVGGSETTMNLIGSGLYSLLRFPDQLARLRADPSLGKNAVEEMLRFESPAQFQSRTTLTEVELSGVTVPASSTLFLCLGSANHDERRWERPDELDIGRTDLQHLAFGYGIHHCLGASLARLEASVAITTVVARLDDIDVVGTPQWGGGAALTQRGLRSLPITFRAR